MPAVAESIALELTPAQRYRLRWADSCLIHAQRLAEWCGHGPVLEEDIALTNMALDLLGQARALLAHVAQVANVAAVAGAGLDEDQLAFLRDEGDYLNLTLVELPMRRSSAHSPPGDFADTVLRNFLLAGWLVLAWQRLGSSNDAELAAIAGKAVKEARYHLQHNADWVVRLGDGSPESKRRMQAALERAWPYTAEMFQHDAIDEAAAASGLGPARRELRAAWRQQVQAVLAEATLAAPADSPFVSRGSNGVHSEHMGFLLAEMQSLQRRYPGGRW
jgi:ring-1,2-phenylacetyl-CoA epoxidase subunit PaaC